MAWRTPPVMASVAADGGSVAPPEGSRVPQAQKRLHEATRAALNAVAEDVRRGLLETVGVGSRLVEGERASVVLELPPDTDTEQIARAIDLENVEAWRDESGRVHVGIGPWHSTKDVDQAVLSVIKVVHVMLGLHASDTPQPKTVAQKILASIAEILSLQQRATQNKDAPPD